MSWLGSDYDSVDESTMLYCKDCKLTWHPEIFFEYRGMRPHGGRVAEYTVNAFECHNCAGEGVEVD